MFMHLNYSNRMYIRHFTQHNASQMGNQTKIFQSSSLCITVLHILVLVLFHKAEPILQLP